MAEYIEREALLKHKTLIPGFIGEYVHVDRIIEAPAVDVQEVRHGRWVYDSNGMDWGLGAWLCSECGCKNDNLGMDNRINPLRFSGSRFCPNCGFRMDLEEPK